MSVGLIRIRMDNVRLAPGQTIDGYEVIELLDRSKDGLAYKVRNQLLDRLELLRVLPKSLQDVPEQVTRFLREAKVHARMSHPNIVAFYHAAQMDGQLVMTTEFVEGTTLAKRRELGALPLSEAIDYISQTLAALEYAHSLGVVHRDVTPSNIILTPGGIVKLTGFGLAKASTDQQLTQPGTVLGSLNYISPEQIKGLGELDARTDIYGTGVVLYELVTGRRPFHHKSQFELMMAHMSELPTAPTILNPDLPAELSEIVLTAMAKDPKARFQSAAEFRQRIVRLGGAESGTPNESVLKAETKRAPSPRTRIQSQTAGAWRLVAAGAFTFLLVMAALLAILRHG